MHISGYWDSEKWTLKKKKWTLSISKMLEKGIVKKVAEFGKEKYKFDKE